MSWQTILAIGSGGFIGAICRAYLNGLVNKNIPHDLPFGTLSVNILGSLILGALFALFSNTSIFSLHIKSFLSTGMMGALTTYSTFALETFWLFNAGNIILALSNIVLNVVGTLVAAGIGYRGIIYFLK